MRKWNLVLTLVLLLLVGKLLLWFVDWAFLDAVWRPDSRACHAASGACWGFIADRYRFILFGTYPFEEHWRPALATILLIALWLLSFLRLAWRPWLVAVWTAGLAAIGVLMWGGVLGLPYVENGRWGGLILTLLLFKADLSIYAFVGIIMLVGLVKKNGIMMVDFAIETQKSGVTAERAIYDACLVRFRPIMMTTMAALMGTLPIALGLGAGAESRRPLGLAVVGGLLFSQMLTLFVTPVFYVYMDKLQKKEQVEEEEVQEDVPEVAGIAAR